MMIETRAHEIAATQRNPARCVCLIMICIIMNTVLIGYSSLMTVLVKQNVQYMHVSCTQLMSMYVLYSTAVVVVMQYAHYGV